MISVIVMLLALLSATVIEMAFPALAWLGQAKPPLVMGLVLYYAVNRSFGLMLAAALLGGVISDSIHLLPLGYSALCLSLIGILVSRHRAILFGRRWITGAVLGALAAIAMTLGLYGLLCLSNSSIQQMSIAWITMKILGTGVYALLLVPVVFYLMEWLDCLVGNMNRETSA